MEAKQLGNQNIVSQISQREEEVNNNWDNKLISLDIKQSAISVLKSDEETGRISE